MVEAVRVYLLLAGTWMRSAAQYPASMVMLVATQAVATSLDLAAILIIFAHTPRLGGFSLPEVMFLYGTAGVSFAVADVTLGTSERLGEHIRQGTLDTLLVRPVGPLVQIATEDFSPRRMGKLVPTVTVLVVSLVRLPIAWTPVRVMAVPLMIACGIWIFGALWVLTAAWQFAVVDGKQAGNSVTYGGAYLTQYPLSLFGRDALRGLTWVLPLAFVNWEPALYVLRRADPLGLPVFFRFAAPLVAAVLSVLAALAWRTGLRHYRSTGS
ncbi:ABC transporter permease [Actinoallomurus bryophytorum]|uniref:ABC-2 type transport system permease protein n=1 Tax=Actinoallomurus bryophytorum TaxID=1490222 RepID=A0A543C0E1_9ACTN|nr:ABC-2 family transporter protein [Actinoallomurus bryophytorum]TQL90528.1 ABC-2 type transport system permease protein [Actinoallomurus bryophytorum]